MAGRKSVKPGHVVENEATFAAESGAASAETCVYQHDMAPLASSGAATASPEAPRTAQSKSEPCAPDKSASDASNASESDSGRPSFVVLKKGGSFCFRGRLFKKDTREPVAPETAERLVRSGYFERG